MRYLKKVCLFVILFVVVNAAFSRSFCGKNLFSSSETRENFYSNLVKLSDHNIKHILKDLQNRPFNKNERKLIKLYKKWPPFLVFHTDYQFLCEILSAGEVESPRKGGWANHSNTPISQDQIYSARSCVFFRLGGNRNVSWYGNIKFVFDNNPMDGAWISDHSASHYVPKKFTKNQKVLFHTVLNPQEVTRAQHVFAQHVAVLSAVNRYMPFKIILEIRKLSVSKQQLFYKELLATKTRSQFQDVLFEHKVGGAEGHFDWSVPLSYVKKIFIPKSKLSNLKGCPAYSSWKNLITTY